MPNYRTERSVGNFYANHVLTTGDHHAVVAAVSSLKRHAYVATDGNTTFVYDAQCDMQDLDEIAKLAKLLSKKCGVAVLGTCNHDDDVLWLALARSGRCEVVYNSNPAFDGGPDEPLIGDVAALCAAFSAEDRTVEVIELFRKTDVVFECERHQTLMRLLGASADLTPLGHRYIEQGELPTDRAFTLTPVSSASTARSPARHSGPPAHAVTEFSPGSSEPLAVLALTEIEVPDEFHAILGRGRVNGLQGMMRLQQYLGANRLLVAEGGRVVAQFDEPLRRLFDGPSVPVWDLMAALVQRFDLRAQLSDEDRAALERDDPALYERVMATFAKLTRRLK
jgi:hypothetical protein